MWVHRTQVSYTREEDVKGDKAHVPFQEEARQRMREDGEPWRCKQGSSRVRTPARGQVFKSGQKHRFSKL